MSYPDLSCFVLFCFSPPGAVFATDPEEEDEEEALARRAKEAEETGFFDTALRSVSSSKVAPFPFLVIIGVCCVWVCVGVGGVGRGGGCGWVMISSRPLPLTHPMTYYFLNNLSLSPSFSHQLSLTSLQHSLSPPLSHTPSHPPSTHLLSPPPPSA